MRASPPDKFFRQTKLEKVTPAREVTLELPKAHPRQHDFLCMLDEPGIRFAVGACGTKFGKTYGTTAAMTKQAWEHRDSINWWIAPTYDQSKMAMSHIAKLLPEGMFNKYTADNKLEILTPTGKPWSLIEFKSGDNPDSIRGHAVNFFVIDEAARVKYDSFVSVYTTTTQTMGKGYIISTPDGRGWFYDVYQWGVKAYDDGTPIYEDQKDDPHPDFKSIRMPTWTNPYVQMEAVESAKRNFPEDRFRQEYGAQFLMDSAGVFRGIRDCERGTTQPFRRGGRYVMGVDLARLKDYSVITVLDLNTKHVVHFERFKDLSWAVQYDKIIRTARLYNATVCMDATGIGDPIVQTVSAANLRVVPYKISSNNAKKELIDKLRVNIEKGKISYPHIPVLRKELEAYEYHISDAGLVKFSAPSGQHDDCVISLALANWLTDDAAWVYKMRSLRGI